MSLTERKPVTNNRHESTWDHHGSYQWTYFDEAIKQRIGFFLSQRLNGKNIDVGGGWYLSHPNSTVIDLSSVCLEYNMAKEKKQFDLDELGNGASLPFEDNSFDSATLVSVWQYLRYPKAVVKELRRILRPGTELYIINGQGAGLEECLVNATRSENVKDFFDKLGYDTLIESIPSFDSRRPDEFQAVCVAMPEKNIFGKNLSQIRNKQARIQNNEALRKNPSDFLKAYTDRELSIRARKIAKLSKFPITEYSRGYLTKIESTSQRFYKETGKLPLVFAETVTLPEIAMITPDNKYFIHILTAFFGDFDLKDEKLWNESGLRVSHSMGYFRQKNTEELLNYCKNFRLKKSGYSGEQGNENELQKFVRFITSMGLNSFTKDLQLKMYESLKPNIEELDKMINRQKAFSFHMLTMAFKQRRRIDELIILKDKIENDDTPTVRRGALNPLEIIPQLRQFIK